MKKLAGLTGLSLVLGMLALPCSTSAQTPVIAAAPASLHDRIKAAVDSEPPIIFDRDGLDKLKPLLDEAEASPNVDPVDHAEILRLYAEAEFEQSDVKTAHALTERAAQLVHNAPGDHLPLLADLTNDLGVYQSNLGDAEGGLARRAEALTLTRKAYGDPSPQAGNVLCGMASNAALLGRLNVSLSYYDQALSQMSETVSEPADYATCLGNYSGQLRTAGDPEKSLIYSRKALDIAQHHLAEGDRTVPWAMMNIASSLLDLGRLSDAESIYRQALDFTVKYDGKTSYGAGSQMYNLARCLAREGHSEEAGVLISKAIEIFKLNTGTSPYLAGTAWDALGQLAYQRGDLAQSATRLYESVRILDGLGKRGLTQKANAQVDLALTLSAQGDRPGALAALDLALTYYRSQTPEGTPRRVDAEMLQALLLSQSGQTLSGLQAALPVEQLLEKRLADNHLVWRKRVEFASSYRQAFTRFADIAVRAGRPDLAFRAAQLASLTEVSAISQGLAAQTAASNPVAKDLVRQLLNDQDKYDRLDHQRIFAKGKSDAEATALDAQMGMVDADLATTWQRLSTVFPRYENLSHPKPLTLAYAQSRLPAHTAIVMPLMGDDRVITLVLTAKGLIWDQSPLSQIKATRDVLNLRHSIADSLSQGKSAGFDRQSAFELGRAILTPKLLSGLSGISDLQVVGSGPIMTLPLGLLLIKAPSGRDDDMAALRESAFLIKSFAVSVKPALLIEPNNAKPGSRGFAGIGAPVLGPTAPSLASMSTDTLLRGGGGNIEALRQLPSLPGASDELKAMAKALNRRGSTLVLGKDATKPNIMAMALDHYAVIAFATHGLIVGDLQNLQEPALVLTPPLTETPSDDGLLTASDVAGLHLNANWVILSACNTGAGRDVGAAGYSGLTAAFMQAGARSLLVSLWPVRDDAAARLSVDTVTRSAHGISRSQALRGAVLSLMNDTSVKDSADPAVWAPFSLVAQ